MISFNFGGKMKKNIMINIFFTVTIGILGFVLNKIFAENMGVSDLGLMRLFTQMVAYLSLADLGIASASTYSLYKPLLNKDHDKVSIIISTIDAFYKKIALIIIIVGIVVSIFLPIIIGKNTYGIYLYLYWMLFVINTALSYVFAKYSVLFTANQEFGFVRKIQGSSRVLVSLLQILILIYTQSFLFFIIILISQNIFNYYYYYKHFKKKYTFVVKKKEKENKILIDMKNLFWHKVAGLVVYNTDYILLAKFTSLRVVALYSSYLLVYTVILTIVGILTPVLTPKIGQYIAKNKKKEIYEYWEKLHLLYMMAGIILVTVSYYMVNPFIKLWMGEDYLLPSTTVLLILINLYVQITRNMTEAFKSNSGFYDDIYNPILEAIINFVISFILVQKIGLNGVLIGTISSNIVIIYILKPMLVFIRCFDKKIKDYVIIFGKYLFLTFLILFVSNIILKNIYEVEKINSWLVWIENAIKITGIVTIVTSALFLLDRVFREVILLSRYTIKRGG